MCFFHLTTRASAKSNILLVCAGVTDLSVESGQYRLDERVSQSFYDGLPYADIRTCQSPVEIDVGRNLLRICVFQQMSRGSCHCLFRTLEETFVFLF